MLSKLLDCFIFLFVVIDPLAVIPMFILLTQHDTEISRRKTAIKSCIIALTILLIFAFAGEGLLGALGISTPALQISGGILLLLVAIEMVIAGHTESPDATQDSEKRATGQRHDISVFPLAIPLIAGPAALTAVVMQMREASGSVLHQGGIIFILLIVVGITYLLLSFAPQLMRLFGVTMTSIMTRVFGVILAALACQFLLNGLSVGLIKPFLS